MGIENIDDLKSGKEVLKIYPKWPSVRCTNTKCGRIYKIEAPPGVFPAEGDCPGCHNVKFNTQMENQ